MNLVVFGASGGTGRELVVQGIDAGHRITAFVRNAASLPMRDDKLRIIEGDVQDAKAVETAVHGQQAVLSALGATGRIRVCTIGMAGIIRAMNDTGVRRLCALSSFGASESRDKGLYSLILWAWIKERMEDKEGMEALIRKSNLDWTIIRAPALNNRKKTGRYRLKEDATVSLLTAISRANVACAMLEVVTAGTQVGNAVTILPGS
jgi:putative NADH-flavin reductase